YSCFNFQACSLWMSFGVYVTGVLFQTAAFVSFLLISHGYCIMCEHLSLNERRSTAALACVFYLTLVGYKASVPYFTVLLLLNYFISFYVIFHHISQNLLVLREQLSIIENEDVRAMHDAVYKKYIMFNQDVGKDLNGNEEASQEVSVDDLNNASKDDNDNENVIEDVDEIVSKYVNSNTNYNVNDIAHEAPTAIKSFRKAKKVTKDEVLLATMADPKKKRNRTFAAKKNFVIEKKKKNAKKKKYYC
ncbi:hypothetical protein RYX36_035159, partial [Vicia faba]